MKNNFTSYPNQDIVVGSVLEPCDKQHNFMTINIEAYDFASNDLSYSGFCMWIYFSKNQPDYQFALSRADCMKHGFKKDTYYKAIKELEEKGYLTKESNRYTFHQLPVSDSLKNRQEVVQSEKQTSTDETRVLNFRQPSLKNRHECLENRRETIQTIHNNTIAASPHEDAAKIAESEVYDIYSHIPRRSTMTYDWEE